MDKGINGIKGIKWINTQLEGGLNDVDYANEFTFNLSGKKFMVDLTAFLSGF